MEATSATNEIYQPVDQDQPTVETLVEDEIPGDEFLSQPSLSSSRSRVNLVCFWLLGLFNNSSYVIMIACAKNISEGGTAVVFLVNIAPSFLVKLSAPYWFDHVSYQNRIMIATISMVGSFMLVASNSSDDTGRKFNLALQLIGVALGSFQSGLGEATLLALSGKRDAEQREDLDGDTSSKGRSLTCFSSGTGMAGVFGFFWKWFWTDLMGFEVSTMLWLAMIIPLGYWVSFRVVMNSYRRYPQPSIPNANQQEISSETQALNVGTFEISPAYSPEDEAAVPISELSTKERLRLFLGLWIYIVPLFVVYAAEYALQSGTWTAIGFPVTDIDSRDHFYEFSNWMYQGGVFLSRSSGTLWTAPLWFVWMLPGLQSINVLVFYYIASHPTTSAMYSPRILYAGAFYAGLLGGSCYINTYKRICQDLPLVHQEFALSSTSVGESFGIILADISGLFIQACLYKANGLEGVIVQCPL